MVQNIWLSYSIQCQLLLFQLHRGPFLLESSAGLFIYLFFCWSKITTKVLCTHIWLIFGMACHFNCKTPKIHFNQGWNSSNEKLLFLGISQRKKNILHILRKILVFEENVGKCRTKWSKTNFTCQPLYYSSLRYIFLQWLQSDSRQLCCSTNTTFL